jgi:hypothetical protein
MQRENMARNTTKKSKKQLTQTTQSVAPNGHETPKVPASAIAAPTPSTPQIAVKPQPARVSVRFWLPFANAGRVCVSGDFNQWSSDAAPLKRYEDGHWEATVDLAPGRYEYKFVCDGHWIPDPTVDEHVWNHHGTLNSVIQVRA